MFQTSRKKQPGHFFRLIAFLTILSFSANLVVLPAGSADMIVLPAHQQRSPDLPAPGTMLSASPRCSPVTIKAVTIHPENPLKFDFIIDLGNAAANDKNVKEESSKLIRYFLASLTVPEDEMWVNLSPFEKERIIPEPLSVTEMGRDLLVEDYILKQLTASLMYPGKELGRKFWDKVYKQVYERYGRANISANTFNKVWIIPDKAVVYEHEYSAFVVESRLKVMLEQDYHALVAGRGDGGSAANRRGDAKTREINDISALILKEVIIPEIEKEVNEGAHFAKLRQIYSSMVLAAWFKRNLRESLLGQVYVNRNKISGINRGDAQAKQKIYQQYLEAFKKGVFNYVKSEYDPVMLRNLQRTYFSGGFDGSVLKDAYQEITDPGTLSGAQTGNLPDAKNTGLRTVSVVLTEPGESVRSDVVGKQDDETPAIGLIGKQYEVENVVFNEAAGELQVAAREAQRGKKKKLSLHVVHNGNVDENQKEMIIKAAGESHKPMLRKILARVPAGTRMVRFDTTAGDLFGFPVPSQTMIAIHQAFANDQVAVFHELSEFLIEKGVMRLALQGNELLCTIDNEQFSLLLDDEQAAIAGKSLGVSGGHYLLRALQRKAFGEQDRKLTSKIVLEQRRVDLVTDMVRSRVVDQIKTLFKKQDYTFNELQQQMSDTLTALAEAGVITKANREELKSVLTSRAFNEWGEDLLAMVRALARAGVIRDDNVEELGKLFAALVASGKGENEIAMIREFGDEVVNGHLPRGILTPGFFTRMMGFSVKEMRELKNNLKLCYESGVLDENNYPDVLELLAGAVYKHVAESCAGYNIESRNKSYGPEAFYLLLLRQFISQGIWTRENAAEVSGFFELMTRIDARSGLLTIDTFLEKRLLTAENIVNPEALFDLFQNDGRGTVLLAVEFAGVLKARLEKAVGGEDAGVRVENFWRLIAATKKDKLFRDMRALNELLRLGLINGDNLEAFGELLTGMLYQRLAQEHWFNYKNEGMFPRDLYLQMIRRCARKGILTSDNVREIGNFFELMTRNSSQLGFEAIDGFLEKGLLTAENVAQREVIFDLLQQYKGSGPLLLVEEFERVLKGRLEKVVGGAEAAARVDKFWESIKTTRETERYRDVWLLNEMLEKEVITGDNLETVGELLTGTLYKRVAQSSRFQYKNVNQYSRDVYLQLILRCVQTGIVTRNNVKEISDFFELMTRNSAEYGLKTIDGFLEKRLLTAENVADLEAILDLLQESGYGIVLLADEFEQALKRRLVKSIGGNQVERVDAFWDRIKAAKQNMRFLDMWALMKQGLINGENLEAVEELLTGSLYKRLEQTSRFQHNNESHHPKDLYLQLIIRCAKNGIVTPDNIIETGKFFELMTRGSVEFGLKTIDGFLKKGLLTAENINDPEAIFDLLQASGFGLVLLVDEFEQVLKGRLVKAVGGNQVERVDGFWELIKAAKQNRRFLDIWTLHDLLRLGLVTGENLSQVGEALAGKVYKSLDAKSAFRYRDELRYPKEVYMVLLRRFASSGILTRDNIEDVGKFFEVLAAQFDGPAFIETSKLFQSNPEVAGVIIDAIVKGGITSSERLSSLFGSLTENAVIADAMALAIRVMSGYERANGLQQGIQVDALVQQTIAAVKTRPVAPAKGFSPVQIAEKLLAGLGFNGDVYTFLLPEEARSALGEETTGELFAEVDSSNYREEKYAAAVYLQLLKMIPAVHSLTYEEFIKFLEGSRESAHGVVITQFMQRYVFKQEVKLTVEQQRKVIALSIALHNKVLTATNDATASVVTFRELIRFNTDFSRFYLQHNGLENALELFILTAYNIYGQTLVSRQDKDSFTRMLENLFYSREFKQLFAEAQVQSESLQGADLREVIENIIRYGDYENLHRRAAENQVPLKVNIRAKIESAGQVQRASLLIVDDDNSLFVEDVVREMAEEPDTVMLRIPVSGFSKRRELFGMYIPRKAMAREEIDDLIESADGDDIKAALKNVLASRENEVDTLYEEWQSAESLAADQVVRATVAVYLKYRQTWREMMSWQDGILVKMAREAGVHPTRKYFINLDNISAMPSSVRLLLNPVLWERFVEIPERGQSVALPDNMNFIMTMSGDTEIKDESFMNRPLVKHIDSVTEEDMRLYLREKTSLAPETIALITGIYSRLKTSTFKQEAFFNFNDVLEIARRVEGIARDGRLGEAEIVSKEAHDYLYLRIRDYNDRRQILRRDILGGVDPAMPLIAVDRESGTVNFDGVILAASSGFMDHARRNPGLNFEELCASYRDFAKNGYIVTEMEMRVLSQLARAYRFGGHVVQIEGPSGEGKTEVGRVFSNLIGLSIEERTINQDTGLAEFRGQIRPTRDGRYELYEPEYLRQIGRDGHAFLFNEINTNESGALYYWLFPEITRRAEKHAGEFATDDDSLVKRLRIDQNNLWLFTVNPESFHGRITTPRRVRAHVPVFFMAQDENSLPQITAGLFISANLSEYTEYSVKLAALHKALRELKLKRSLESPQDVTPRDLIAVVEGFRKGVADGELPDAAFRKAVDSVYVYMWKELSDIVKARTIVDRVLGKSAGTNGLEALRQALRQNGRPVLVFFNAANDVNALLEKEISAADSRAIITHVPLSRFHRKRQFIGGLMPKQKAPADSLPANTETSSVRFEEKLGILPALIKQARLNGDRDVVAVFYNYTHLSPQVAPLLNEFFQTGRVEGIGDIITERMAEELLAEIERTEGAWERLREEFKSFALPLSVRALNHEEKAAFARWFYGNVPGNLRFVATGSSEEEMTLSPAEINRFLPVNIALSLNRAWVRDHVARSMDPRLRPHEKLITDMALEAFELYRQQQANMEYDHNRLSGVDVDMFLEELRGYDGELDEQIIRKLAFYTMAIGLRPSYRNRFSYQDDMADPASRIGYEQRDDGIYFYADGIRFKTGLQSVPATRFLAPTRNLVQQLAGMLIALRQGRVLVVEGYPGGGKTASVDDLAKRLGILSYSEMMYEDVDLGDFMGRLSKEGKEFVLTAWKRDLGGNFVIPFLKAYTQGGIQLLDEGAMGTNSQEAIAFLVELSQLDEFDLGMIHPGLEGTVLKKHKDFHLVIAQNPARMTKGREPLTYRVDTISQKIWTDNLLSHKDAMTIIDYHLEPAGSISEEIKGQVAAIHNELCMTHPRKEELSPRQLITVARAINKAVRENGDIRKAVFEGLMIAYLSGLEKGEFTKMWAVVSRVTGNGLSAYLEAWKEEIKVESGGGYINFNGVRLPSSSGEGNLAPEDIFYTEDIPSHRQIMRTIALGMSLNMPIAIFDSEGADALDIVKKFCYMTGYDFEALWSHPQMTRMQILSTIMPKFEEQFDRYGIRREDLSDEFVMSLGAIARHLMKERDYRGLSEKQKQEQRRQVLFVNSMDAIPERQRVMLNQLFTTGQAGLINEQGASEAYVLPEWVHFVVSASERRNFSSAFINRFLPVNAGHIEQAYELRPVLQNRYPLVRAQEVEWIHRLAGRVSRYDRNEIFGIHYGFTHRDVYKLAQLIQLEKQRDIEAGRFKTNPLYYVLKAAHIVYSSALEDEDLRRYEQEIMKEYFLLPLVTGTTMNFVDAFYQNMAALINNELAQIQREAHEIRIDAASLAKGGGVTLPNQIYVQKTADGFVIQTAGANEYQVTEEEIRDWKVLSDNGRGISVKREGEQLALRLSLIGSVGGVEIPRDDYNRSRALPEDEVPTREFVRYTDEISRMVAACLRGWRRVEDFRGHVSAPRVLMWNGYTGTAKTTLARNLSHVLGVPIYILNSYEEMKVSDITVGLKFRQGAFELGVKEFLARVGTVNGQRIMIPSKESSSRSIVLIDEANASPDILFALAPLFRGEKKFSVEYAGESFEVEVDDELLVVLTFNPTEKYSGRGSFAREIVSYADKLWAPNPLKYGKDVLIDILSEYHHRGITGAKKQTREPASPAAVSTAVREGHVSVRIAPERVVSLSHPEVRGLAEVLLPVTKKDAKEIAETDNDGNNEEISKQESQNIELAYDTDEIKREAAAFESGQGYLEFAARILKGYLLAIANGNSDDELREAVLGAAIKLDPDLDGLITAIAEMYRGQVILERDFRQALFDLKRLFSGHGVYLILQLIEKGQVPYVQLIPVPINRIEYMLDEQLRFIGEDPLRYKDRQIKTIYIDDNPLTDERSSGYFDGEYAVVLENRVGSGSNIPVDEQKRLTAWHENGHMLDKERLAARDITVPKEATWTELTESVNALETDIWMSENFELNSMLFPMIFSPYANQYAIRSLVGITLISGDRDDYYCQAAKGILNGLIRYSQERNGSFQESALITDSFEAKKIEAVKNWIMGVSSSELNGIGAKLYQDPKKYLSSAKKGIYRAQVDMELIQGADGSPETDQRYIDGKDNVHVEAPPPEGNQAKLQREKQDKNTAGMRGGSGEKRPGGGGDQEGEGAEDGDTAAGDGTDDPSLEGNSGSAKGGKPRDDLGNDLLTFLDTDDNVNLADFSPNLLAKFQDTFAGNPRMFRIYSDNGDEIDIEKIITGDLEPFYKLKIVQGQASLSTGITIDIGHSARRIQAADGRTAHDHFLRMARLFASLFYYSSVRNKDIDFTICGIGTKYHEFLRFEQSRDKGAVENALTKLFAAKEDGIYTPPAIEGIRKKYQKQKQKAHRVEFVFTDGNELSRVGFDKLRHDIEQLEKDLDIDVVFIGLNTRDVENYPKFYNFTTIPSSEELIQVVMKLSLLKVAKGILPAGDLKKMLNEPGEAVGAVMKDGGSRNVGGIDLNPAHLNLQIKRDGKGIPLPINQQVIENVNVSGFVPVILDIAPVTDLPRLTGAEEALIGYPSK